MNRALSNASTPRYQAVEAAADTTLVIDGIAAAKVTAHRPRISAYTRGDLVTASFPSQHGSWHVRGDAARRSQPTYRHGLPHRNLMLFEPSHVIAAVLPICARWE